MSAQTVLKMIKDHKVRFVDLRFSDTRGKEQHVTIPSRAVDTDFFKLGKPFDGSSIAGWRDINESDMLLIPDPYTAFIDPFFCDPTLALYCYVYDPIQMEDYNRDPRGIARRTERYLKSTGIADKAMFGPEPEFFIFDDIRWNNAIETAFYEIDSDEADWRTGTKRDEGNHGHRPRVKGGYFPVPPVDSLQDIRASMCTTLEDVGIEVEVHHHEVGTAGQCEIGTKYDTLVRRADKNQLLKYVVLNVAHNYGKTATFMPKPVVGDNGSGMHVHISLMRKGKNLFSGKEYGGMSKIALHFIGGIIKHARAINAFANSATNSYKRLVPGYEAPVLLAYSMRNRSAAIRLPFDAKESQRRIEVRFPDAAGNPYLTFSAMLLAGIDGVLNELPPGDPMDMDLYHLSPEEERKIPKVCYSLEEALEALDKDRKFLKAGEAFSDDAIDAYIKLKMDEVSRVHRATHPAEFDMYYSC